MHQVSKKIWVPAKQEEVFEFFADAWNLQKITPPELNFKIVTPRPFQIRKDALIEYQLKLAFFKFSWTTIISEWNPPNMFADEQFKGPYKYWHHTHTFKEFNGGTQISDIVDYELPFFPIGELAYPIIKLQLRRIFNYREKVIKNTFKY